MTETRATCRSDLVDGVIIVLLWGSLQPRKQFELHALSRKWATHDFTYHVGPRGKIVLEDGLPSPLHIGKHTLVVVPTKQFICDTVGVVWISAYNI